MSWLFSMQGRIDRRQWWLGHLLNAMLMGVFAAVISTIDSSPLHVLTSSKGGFGLGPTIGATLVCFWIGLASTVKRYHDRNKSGWWAAITLIPGLGIIWSFYECGLMQGTPGDNAYGPVNGHGVSANSLDRDREAELECEIAVLRAHNARAAQQEALANARYASDVRKIMAAE